jgi:hypothetical protein
LTVLAGLLPDYATASGLERLLPANTKGFLAVTDSKDLSQRWQSTDVGKMLGDPAMRPFLDDFRGQFRSRLTALQDKLGMTLDDLSGVPGGELCIALVPLAPQKSAAALVIDVAGHQPQAAALVKSITAAKLKAGARLTRARRSGMDVLAFTQPHDPSTISFALGGGLLVATDDPGVLDFILAQAAGGKGRSLADAAGFQHVMRRCRQDAGSTVPQIRWFLEPQGFMESLAAETPDRTPLRRGRPWIEVFKSQGFEGLQALGGFIEVGQKPFQVVHRTAVYAPRPRNGSMVVLSFPNTTEFQPQPWVPKEVTGYSTFYFDVLTAFDNVGPLFDEVYGDGDTGMWQNLLKNLKDAPDGPKVDLRAELIARLGSRITILSDYVLPITTGSQRLLFAVETRDDKAVTLALEKLLRNDKKLRMRQVAGHMVWEAVPEEPRIIPTISLSAVPPLTSNADDDPPPDLERKKTAPLLPHAAVSVAYGQLLIASHYDFLAKVLAPREPKASLAEDAEYREAETISLSLSPGPCCLRSFVRTDLQLRPIYTMIREGKLPQNEGLWVRAMNTFFAPAKASELRRPRIDGHKLPNYEVVRRALGPSGVAAGSEPDGWFIKGYLYRKTDAVARRDTTTER